MRTTIDLDESLLRRLRDEAHAQGIPFRSLLHRVIQRELDAGLQGAEPPYRVPQVALGPARAGVDLTKALALASALEDDEIIAKLAQGR